MINKFCEAAIVLIPTTVILGTMDGGRVARSASATNARSRKTRKSPHAQKMEKAEDHLMIFTVVSKKL
ncbi:hypothetical protein DMENIID0001_162020 [Sergentomyia squamirostris]